jgi:hypothetical protein
MWIIEPVIDPDNPNETLCYLVINGEDIPIGNYNTIEDAVDAIKALRGDAEATRGQPRPIAPYSPS